MTYGLLVGNLYWPLLMRHVEASNYGKHNRQDYEKPLLPGLVLQAASPQSQNLE